MRIIIICKKIRKVYNAEQYNKGSTNILLKMLFSTFYYWHHLHHTSIPKCSISPSIIFELQTNQTTTSSYGWASEHELLCCLSIFFFFCICSRSGTKLTKWQKICRFGAGLTRLQRNIDFWAVRINLDHRFTFVRSVNSEKLVNFHLFEVYEKFL